jgi:hypothetical protein
MTPPVSNRGSDIMEPLLSPHRSRRPKNHVDPHDKQTHEPNGHQTRWGPTPIVNCVLVMAGLWLGAFLVALGQHFFYSFLNGVEIQFAGISQTWVVRFGTAFSFIFKTLLVGALAVIYAQVLWFSVQQNAVRIGSLNAMFGVLNNPLLFFNRELMQKTSSLFLIAIVSWLVPLSAVVAPGALTGRSRSCENLIDSTKSGGDQVDQRYRPYSWAA